MFLIYFSRADISASMQEFEWYYRKESFPKLKDDGKGNASVSSCKVNTNFYIFSGIFSEFFIQKTTKKIYINNKEKEKS